MIKVGNKSQLPAELQAHHAAKFDGVTGDTLTAWQSSATYHYYVGKPPAFTDPAGITSEWDGPALDATDTYLLVVPADADPPPSSPPGPTPLDEAKALRDAAKAALDTALATYLAIPSPTPTDLEPVTAAQMRLAECEDLVSLRS